MWGLLTGCLATFYIDVKRIAKEIISEHILKVCSGECSASIYYRYSDVEIITGINFSYYLLNHVIRNSINPNTNINEHTTKPK